MLAASEHEQDLTIILAGYKDDLEKKLYSYNDGLKRRFKVEFHFEDYSESELLQIWERQLKESATKDEDGTVLKPGWHVETTESGNASVVAARRVARGKGRKGHGNAAAIKSLFENAMTAAKNRSDFDASNLCLKIVDIIGPDPSQKNGETYVIPLLDEAMKKLETFSGLKEVKQAIYELVEVASTNYQNELAGYDILELPLNRLFLGNPGTGKTSILEIYGKVLKALRYLSDGTIEYKTASDFIGDKKGQTQTQTAAIFKNCQGKVLFIDEAYNLDDDSYGAKAIDTIVEQIDTKSGADMAVIMAGYEKEMMKMLRDQNPGLSSRFDPARALFFRDFDNKALGRLVLLFLHGGLTFYS